VHQLARDSVRVLLVEDLRLTRSFRGYLRCLLVRAQLSPAFDSLQVPVEQPKQVHEPLAGEGIGENAIEFELTVLLTEAVLLADSTIITGDYLSSRPRTIGEIGYEHLVAPSFDYLTDAAVDLVPVSRHHHSRPQSVGAGFGSRLRFRHEITHVHRIALWARFGVRHAYPLALLHLFYDTWVVQ